MFGFRRLFHRKDEEDYDELRSHVLGERLAEQPEPPPSFEQPASRFGQAPSRFGPPSDEYEEFSPKTRDLFEPFPTMQPPGTLGAPAARPELERTAEKTSRDYEILDRLDMIESQIAVVRSQTETINERLKNLEAKLGTSRRY